MAYLGKLNAKTGGGLGGMPEKKNPAGSVIYGRAGTYTFKVPKGVTSICAVCIGGSSYAIAESPSQGGGLSYKNNILVNENSAVVITVGGSDTPSSVAVNGTIVCKGANVAGVGDFCSIGGDGSDGLYGGGAGGYYGNGSGQSVGNNGSIVGSYALIGANGSTGGYGAGSVTVIAHGYQDSVAGVAGGVKIIWGSNRSFPNNRCHNIED